MFIENRSLEIIGAHFMGDQIISTLSGLVHCNCQTINISPLCGCVLATSLASPHNRIKNLHVARTATKIACESGANICF